MVTEKPEFVTQKVGGDEMVTENGFFVTK